MTFGCIIPGRRIFIIAQKFTVEKKALRVDIHNQCEEGQFFFFVFTKMFFSVFFPTHQTSINTSFWRQKNELRTSIPTALSTNPTSA
jgi:hypothetical protein